MRNGHGNYILISLYPNTKYCHTTQQENQEMSSDITTLLHELENGDLSSPLSLMPSSSPPATSLPRSLKRSQQTPEKDPSLSPIPTKRATYNSMTTSTSSTIPTREARLLTGYQNGQTLLDGFTAGQRSDPHTTYASIFVRETGEKYYTKKYQMEAGMGYPVLEYKVFSGGRAMRSAKVLMTPQLEAMMIPVVKMAEKTFEGKPRQYVIQKPKGQGGIIGKRSNPW